MRKKLGYISGLIAFVTINILIRSTDIKYYEVLGIILATINILLMLISFEVNISINRGGKLLYRYRNKSRAYRRVKTLIFSVIGLALYVSIKYFFYSNRNESLRFAVWMMFTFYIIMTVSFIISDFNGVQVREKMLVNCFSYYRWKKIKSFELNPDHCLKITVYGDDEITMQLDEGIQKIKCLKENI